MESKRIAMTIAAIPSAAMQYLVVLTLSLESIRLRKNCDNSPPAVNSVVSADDMMAESMEK